MPEKKKLSFFELLRQGWKPYWALAQYMKPYRGRFVIGLLCGVAAGMLNGVFPLVVKLVGEKIFPSGQRSKCLQGAHGRAVNRIPGPASKGVLWISLLIPVAMVARGVFSFLNGYCMAWVSRACPAGSTHQVLSPPDLAVAGIFQSGQVRQTHFASAQRHAEWLKMRSPPSPETS